MNILSKVPMVYAIVVMPVLMIRMVMIRPDIDSGLISLNPTVLIVMSTI
jgi:hypothetical protein